MKRHLSESPFLWILFPLLITGISCSKEFETTVPEKGTLSQMLTSASNLTFYRAAFVKANLEETFGGATAYTVFAPTDEAFQAAGFTANTINSLTAEQLKTILLYHAIPASLLKAEIPETPNAKLITAAGDSVFITRTGTGVFVNGIEVNDFDLIATNGIIHRLSGVLAPPTGNLMQTATANPDFSFFLAAVVRASSSSTPVAQLLASDNIFTVFAPTNEAFKAAGWVSLEAITAVDPSQLLEIVLNHIVPGRHFSAQLTPGKMLASLSGKSLLVGSGGGATTIKGAGSTAGSFITATNIVARNGVVHVVEKLLLP